MTPDRLTHIEDLTRRYAKYRPCGAGLGALSGGIIYQLFAGSVLGWVLRQAEPLNGFKEVLRARIHTPPFLQVLAITVPLFIWLSILLIQKRVDRRFGVVTGEAQRDFLTVRWLAPGAVILLAAAHLAFGAINAHILFPGDPRYAMGALSITGTATIMLLAGVWGRSARDPQTLLLMMTTSLPSLFILRPGPGDLFIFAFISCAYLALMFWLMISGALRFGEFLKVSRELDALQLAAE